MGYTEVREAVREWIAGQEIVGVGDVYRDAPYWIGGESFPFQVTNGEYAAVLFVHLDTSRESRITLPAPAPPNRTAANGFVGSKLVSYVISIGILYQWMIPGNTLEAPKNDEWVVPLDYIIDTLKARIRSDPNLGASPTIVFQAGQDNDGISLDQDLPSLDPGGGIVKCFARLQLSLDEIITA